MVKGERSHTGRNRMGAERMGKEAGIRLTVENKAPILIIS